VLAALAGRGPPLTLVDTVIGPSRFVRRVHFDSLSFFDGMFYRRHLSEGYVVYSMQGDSTFSNDVNSRISGSFAATGPGIVWRPYIPGNTRLYVGTQRALESDSLAFMNGALWSRISFPDRAAPIDGRYDRVR
jgi:hypothetical protein